MARKKYIGEILVEEGFIEAEHLREALGEQKRQIGQILIDKGYLDEKDLDEALKVQVGIARSERYSTYLRVALVLLLLVVAGLAIQYLRANEQANFLDRLAKGELAAEEVRRIIDEPGVAHKMEALRSLDNYTPGEREELLKKALQSELWYVRLYAIMLAQSKGNPRLVASLIPLTLKSEEPVVRFAAAQALEKITGVPNGRNFDDWLNYAKLQGLTVKLPAKD